METTLKLSLALMGFLLIIGIALLIANYICTNWITEKCDNGLLFAIGGIVVGFASVIIVAVSMYFQFNPQIK